MGRRNKYSATPTVMGEAAESGYDQCAANGARLTKPFADAAAAWSYAAAASGIVNTTTAVTVKAAAGAGLKNYINAIQIATDTLGTATELVIRSGAGGTVLFRVKLNTTAMPLQTIEFPIPIASAANTLLEVATLTASTTGGVFVNVQGYVAP